MRGRKRFAASGSGVKFARASEDLDNRSDQFYISIEFTKMDQHHHQNNQRFNSDLVKLWCEVNGKMASTFHVSILADKKSTKMFIHFRE